METQRIAILGLACRYPDAHSPAELWQNALAQRKAFRRIPAERLNVDDYWSRDPDAADSTYITEGAFLADYEFDRARFRVSGDAHRASDMAHWLALDVAADTLADAGFADAEGLPKANTAVYLGNTLTGETSRAQTLRHRWPYVRRVLAASLAAEGHSEEQIQNLLDKVEAAYKEPFAPPGPESLVGGLANTIAGRICNFFNLQGGGYVVDGACASSLLAIANACSALVSGDIDAALAGGVDLSIDPFELIGFSRVGALARHEMRVYDRRSAGFLPGEGCGMLLLMREADALAASRPIYAFIRGWGISSDGAGSMTRPEISGQTLAFERAYRRAGIDISSVGYFEGHGTGTEAGDLTELKTIGALRSAKAAMPAVIGSIKANIGHTKAAAGAAGLIKATMALHSRVLPPATGCDDPHPELAGNAALRVLKEPEPWGAPLTTAGVRFAAASAMGFGGINTHVVLEEAGTTDRVPAHELRKFAASPQDAELFLLAADDVRELTARVSALAETARHLSIAEMSDAAAALDPSASGAMRAAVVASTPLQLTEKLVALRALLEQGITHKIDPAKSIYLSSATHPPRIGLLFPGQSAPVRRTAGALGRRFPQCGQLYIDPLPAGPDSDTSVAQPAVVAASLSALLALDALGITGAVAVGHSLGEITALSWAGAIDTGTAMRIAHQRGELMMRDAAPGAMVSVAAASAEIEPILPPGVVVAGVNGPRQTVVSGQLEAISHFTGIARARGWHVATLPVSHAFHSPSMSNAARRFAAYLETERFLPIERPVYSTVLGRPLPSDVNLRHLLSGQMTQRVEFQSAAAMAAWGVDVFLEAGPGAILSGLVSQFLETPAISLDAGSDSFRGLLNAAAAAFVLGAPVRLAALFENRFTKPFTMTRPKFLANPCEQAPRRQSAPLVTKPKRVAEPAPGPVTAAPIEAVRKLIARHVELPLASVREDHRLFSDLHLNSIAVTQIVAQAARELGAPAPLMPTSFANATVANLTEALLETAQTVQEPRVQLSTGLAPWVRCFAVEWVCENRPAAIPLLSGASDWRIVMPPGDHRLAQALAESFSKPGRGVLVYVPPGAGDQQAGLLLDAARLLRPDGNRFVLVHHGDGSSGFARSLHSEYPRVDVSVVRIPVSAGVCEDVYREAAAARGFEEVWYDEAGTRRVPRLRHVPVAEASPSFLNEDDVLLATGGGKGIGAECAIALARTSSARLLVLGRSAPETDSELAQNLKRMEAAGIRFRYLHADISNRTEVVDAIREGERAFGKISAILHASGRNAPSLIESLNADAVAATLAPKVTGLRNVLAAVSPDWLRLLVSFGSIIGRIGMRGNADYALANERLRQITDEFGAAHPTCRCLTLEWSLWSGVGMGERLGSVESLAQQGITAISPEQGTALLASILAEPSLPSSLIVASRFQTLPDLPFERADPPLSRFLEKTELFVPGVELIAEANLSLASDPYLADHVFERTPLLPAVMGMEAMAQTAAALGDCAGATVWRDLAFERPITVPPHQTATIRVYASAAVSGEITVAVRADQTEFQLDHFRGTVRFEAAPLFAPVPEMGHLPELSRATSLDLYGTVLFQSGRFQRLESYSFLSATACRAHLRGAIEKHERWFGAYYPSQLILGDPGVRDAAIHSIQACIPHRTVVPTRVDEVRTFAKLDSREIIVQAVERSSSAGTFVYDLDLLDANGGILEQWRGLTLRSVEASMTKSIHAAGLIGPYLERRLREIVPDTRLHVTFRADSSETASMLQPLEIVYRPDGKPEARKNGAHRRETFVSAAHGGRFHVAVIGSSAVGCDLEPVRARDNEQWRDLLGPEQFAYWTHLAARGSNPAELATRLWCVRESLIKLGDRLPPLLRVSAESPDGWMEFAAHDRRIQTCVLTPEGEQGSLVFAVAH